MAKTSHPYLLDTSVIIGHLRGNVRDAEQWVLRAFANTSIGISVVTEFELWAGAKSPEQERQVKVITARFHRYPMITSIARRAAELYRPYIKAPDAKAHLPDVMIAATAEHYHCDIVTTNVKHFRALPLQGVKIVHLTTS